MEQIAVTLAIPTYRREKVLTETIEQVLAQAPVASEVLVVDQTPEHEEDTSRQLREWADAGAIRWIRQETPNLPQARNRALREASGGIVIFIDDDVILDPGFVGEHAKYYTRSEVVAVAGRVVQAKGWNYGPRPPSWPRVLDHRYFRMDGLEPAEGIATFPGGNHSVRRHAMLALGGYDERYIGWAYREDTDAAVRLWRAGGTIVFAPEASLLHLAAPCGGCRIKGPDIRRPEWMLSFPACYFTVRHLLGTSRGWFDLLVGNVRKYVLRRENVFCPWRVPWAFASYVYSAARAIAAVLFQYKRALR
jgi:GT2 family glycosyltransferase